MNQERKKVLLVAPYFKPHIGGLENYVANIEAGLQSLGWKTVIVTSNDLGARAIEETLDGAKVYRLATSFKVFNSPINLLWYFHLRKIFRKERPDIIYAHAPVPFITDMAALAAGKYPFVLGYHTASMKKGQWLADVIIWCYENTLLKHTAAKAKRIVCPSQFIVSTLLQGFSEKTTIITPGVNSDMFKPSQNQPEKSTILFVARFANMYRMKGLYDLMEAMKHIPNALLKVIGEPISCEQTNVVFLGQKTAAETSIEIQNCSLLALPAHENVESFGMVLIEAMACHKPVIGTRTGGIPEVIRDGVDGIIVPPRDPSALEAAIHRIIENPILAESFADAGYQKVLSQFTWERKVKETDMLLTSVLAQ